MKEKVNDALKAHFRPEFLNRIDDTIVFHELAQHEVRQIVDLMIARTATQLGRSGHGPGAHRRRQGSPQPTRDTTRRSVPVRCVVRSSAWSRTRCRRSSSTRSFRAGEIIIVDVEPDPEQDNEQQIVFRAIEGFEPPAPELEDALDGGDTF